MFLVFHAHDTQVSHAHVQDVWVQKQMTRVYLKHGLQPGLKMLNIAV